MKLLILIAFWVSILATHSFAVDGENIIERPNVKKILLVKELKSGEESEFKNHTTISLQYKGGLIYCHIANDGSAPKIMCH
jgi:hypothetical protein